MNADAASQQLVQELLPEVDEIQDTALREAVITIWAAAWESSEWKILEECPKSPDLPSTRTLVTHSRTVAQISINMCEVLARQNSLTINKDEVIAIALLHDVSKLHEFSKTARGSSKSEIGRKYQHGFLGAFWMQQAGLSVDLVHAVVAHTPLSNVIPQTQEALIVHYADFADTDSLLMDASLPLFCKRK